MARRLAPVLAALLLLLGAAAAAGQPAPAGSLYVALGDSVAAGHGLGDLTAQPDAPYCTRSEDAYPGLLVLSPSFANPAGAGGSVACSGAVSANVLGAPQTVQSPDGPVQLPPQMAVVRALSIAPATVTVTVGANDVGYDTVLDACLRQPGSGPGGPCAGQAPRVGLALENLYENLIQLFADIAALPGTQRILATGYYDPIPEDLTNIGEAMTCGPIGVFIRNATLDGDRAWLQAYLALLNGTIARAAAGAGAQYVDITRVFDGHRFCSDVPWAVPPSAATAADGSAFHPTALGQEAIAQALVRAAGGGTLVIDGGAAEPTG